MKFTATIVAVLSLALSANAQVRGKDALAVENERRLQMSTMTPSGGSGMSSMSPSSGMSSMSPSGGSGMSSMSPSSGMSTMTPGRRDLEKKEEAW